MARPQVEDGHTQIANELLDQLMRLHLSPNQWQVLLCIVRKTYGFKKKVDYIANSQIQTATGLSKSVVSRALKELHRRNIISRNGKVAGLQKDWERWQKVSSLANQQKLAEPSTLGTELAEQSTSKKLAISKQKLAILSTELAELSTKVDSPNDTQNKKETITKETIQKKGNNKGFDLPDFIDREVWDEFIRMRKKIRAPLTDYAARLTISELEKMRGAGEDANEVLRQSIKRCWRGVFPVKEGKVGKGSLPKGYKSPEEHLAGYRARTGAD